MAPGCGCFAWMNKTETEKHLARIDTLLHTPPAATETTSLSAVMYRIEEKVPIPGM